MSQEGEEHAPVPLLGRRDQGHKEREGEREHERSGPGAAKLDAEDCWQRYFMEQLAVHVQTTHGDVQEQNQQENANVRRLILEATNPDDKAKLTTLLDLRLVTQEKWHEKWQSVKLFINSAMGESADYVAHDGP